MRAFADFTDKSLRSCGFNDTNSMTSVNCRNTKTEIHIQIVKMQIIEI